MLTPDQVRLRLQHVFAAMQRMDTDNDASDGTYRATHMLIDLLEHVLPDLLALASGRSYDDAGARYRDRPELVNLGPKPAEGETSEASRVRWFDATSGGNHTLLGGD